MKVSGLSRKNLIFLLFSLFLTTSLFAGLVTDVKATAAPSLINPPDGAYTNDNTPTLSWTAVIGATNYNLQISQKIDFGYPGDPDIFTAGTSFIIPVSVPDGSYYWRVSAYSASGGGWSPWSSVRIFTIDTVAPAAPSLYSPYEDINDPTPLLHWYSVSGANLYNVRVDDNIDMSSPSFDTTTSSITYQLPSITQNMYWYWNVRARDAAGNWGSTSSTWRFRIDTIPPTAATLISPVDGYLSNLVVLECSTAAGANFYVFQIATDSGFTNLVENTKKTIRTHTVNEADGFYYWRVRTEDFAGNFAYSVSRTFSLDRTGPPAPDKLSPSNNYYTTDDTPFLNWVDAMGAVGFQVMVDTTDQFSSPDVDAETVDTHYYCPTLADNRYYWKVRSEDYLGNWGPWGTVWSFVLDTTAPLAPVLVAPADNSEINDDTPLFDWLEVAEPATYHLQVDTSDSFPSPDINLVDVANSYYQVISSFSDGEYFWRVRAEDTVGYVGAWSEIRKVTIDTVGPVAPILVSPEQDDSFSDSTPLILWNSVIDGVEYQLQVDTVDTFVSLVEDITTTNTFYTVLSDLSDGTYFWRVRARDTTNNWGVWSSIWSFNVDLEGPVAPTLSAPSDSAVIGDNTPNLVWSSVGDAVEYEIELSLTPLFEAPLLYTDTTSNNYYVIFFTLDDDVYYWRVKAKDSADNWGAWSEEWSFTVDTVSPNIISPDDIIYEVGATGNNFSWFPQDDNPSNYIVYLNDIVLFSGAWNITAEEIFVNVDELGIGVYNFTLYFEDASGKSNTDSVFVTVAEVIPEYGLTVPLILLPVIYIGVLIIRKRRK